MIKSTRRYSLLFCFGQFFPILKIPAPAKVIVAAIHGAGAAAAKLEIMDSFTFDDISTFLASDCVPDNSRHDDFLLYDVLFSILLFNASKVFLRPTCSKRNTAKRHIW